MLDAYIIDAIYDEERAQERARWDAGRVRIEVPSLSRESPEPDADPHPDADAKRGVIVIPLYPSEYEDTA